MITLLIEEVRNHFVNVAILIIVSNRACLVRSPPHIYKASRVV